MSQTEQAQFNLILDMAVIARIIVTKTGIAKNCPLFAKFVIESKKKLNGAKHQFVLLPGGFLKFSSDTLEGVALEEPQEKAAKTEWNAAVDTLKKQALTEFRRSFDSKMLKALKSVANYLVVGIDSEGGSVQFVLVYDLQSGKPLHWTGKTFPRPNEDSRLIGMPIDTHFIKKRIDGKKVAVFGCHDLSIFSQRDKRFYSPIASERRDKNTGERIKRKTNTPRSQLRCQFIDATLEFCPDIMVQLPHSEGTWAAKWTKLNEWLLWKNGKQLQHFATGLNKKPKKQRSKKRYTLSGTQDGDVVNFDKKGWKQ